MQSISHQLHLAKKDGKGRRCWTEICRKVDGSDKKDPQVTPGQGKASAKKAREGEQILMLYTYTASCQEIFFI